jgi:hypothetical protein
MKNTGINVTIHNVNDRLFFTVPLNKNTTIRYIKNLFCESIYETYNIEDIYALVGSAVTKNLIFLYNQRNIQYYPIILYYNNILQKYITGKSPLKIIQVYRDV